MRKTWFVSLVPLALVAAACGSSNSSSTATTAAAAATTNAPGTTARAGTTAGGSGGAATTAAKPTGAPIHVLGLFPLTGPNADLGNAFQGGAKAGIDAVNASGGVLGRPLVFKGLDTTGDPTKDLSLLQGELNGSDKPSIVLCSTSPECLAILPTATQNKIVTFSQSASAKLDDPKTYPYYFGTSANLDLQIPIGIDWLTANKGTKRLTLVTTNDALGNTFADSTKKAGAAAGIAVTVQQFNPTDVDLTATLEKAKGDNPDSMLFNMNGPPIGYAFSARHKVGLDNVPVLGWNSLVSFEVAKLVPADERPNTTVEALNVQVYQDPSKRSPEFNTFFDAVSKQVGGNITLSLGSYAYHYDAMWMYALAAKQAGAVDADQIQKALENFQPPANAPMVIYSPYKFSATEHFAIPSPSDYQFIPITPYKDGMLQPPS
jgi:branched-chain amino acid transport system substrate-binding protein